MPRKLTTEEFIKKANFTHNNKYDYSKVNYTGSKVIIICPEHGEFLQDRAHLYGNGCPKCKGEITGNLKRNSISLFIENANKIHNGKYDYSKVEYRNNKIKVCIVCHEHGIFNQRPDDHLNKHGCPECKKILIGNRTRLTEENFVRRSIEKHGSKYNYSKVAYRDQLSKVYIVCNIHDKGFWQLPKDHLQGNGCPDCRESKGELLIKKYLDNNTIFYYSQHRFNDCRNILPLPFDFYLPDYNLCIEFDGLQHYIPIELFGGEETFRKLQVNDNIKNQYCTNRNIKLLRIHYSKLSNIENILSINLKEIIQ